MAAREPRPSPPAPESGEGEGESLTGLLALLTCCYANGIFGSWQVVDFLEDHPALRQFCGYQEPEAQDLRRFRREHRSLLQAGLTRLLTRLQPSPGCGLPGLLADPVGQQPLAATTWQAWLAREAESRILCALQMDTIALDE